MIILIVEDEAMVAIHLALELEAAGHTIVGPAATCAAALEFAREHQPTLALLDITLESPHDGIPLARMLRQLGVPSLFLTAQPEVARANADAAMGLIEKPYTSQRVCQSLQIIGTILAGTTPAADNSVLELFPPFGNAAH